MKSNIKDNKEIKSIFSKKQVNRIQNKINLLGVNCKYTVNSFLIVRIITSIILFIIVFSNFKYGYIIGIVLTILYYYMFEKVLLDDKIKKRTSKLNNEAIYFFEVLTLSLQTGRNLNEAISITVNGVDNELSKEFRNAIRETRFGKSLTESLTDMQKNIPSDSINNIILALTQANMYGSSIIDTMYNQVDYLRERRKMEVKAIISKVPTKISIISVFFFIPLILLIILGPLLITFISG